MAIYFSNSSQLQPRIAYTKIGLLKKAFLRVSNFSFGVICPQHSAVSVPFVLPILIADVPVAIRLLKS